MTLAEFKAWFEGFTEDMASPPNKKQWERIKARVGEITGQSISYPVYIDRYVRPVRPYWEHVWTTGGCLLGAQGLAGQGYNAASSAFFDSAQGLYAVGKADALALKAA